MERTSPNDHKHIKKIFNLIKRKEKNNNQKNTFYLVERQKLKSNNVHSLWG